MSVFYLKRFFFFLLLSTHVFAQAPLEKKDVHEIMDEILSSHLTEKKLSQKIFDKSLENYIELFDPKKVYFLKQEAKLYYEPSVPSLQRMKEDYKNNQFTTYEVLNQSINKASLRAQKIRQQIKEEVKQALGLDDIIASLLPLSEGYASTEQELVNRWKIFFVYFAKGQKGAKKLSLERLFEEFDQSMRLFEQKYELSWDNTPLAKEQQSFFYMHILKALTQALDAHTSFLDEQDAEEIRMRLEKEYNGVGILLKQIPEGWMVRSVIAKSEAEKSSKIFAGDILLAVSGKEVKKLPLEDVKHLLRGEKGTLVKLLLRRNQETFTVVLTRGVVQVDEGRAKASLIGYRDGVIGVIKLDSFYQGENNVSSERDVKEAIASFKKQGKLLGLVLDLRENTGGFLHQAVKVAGLFITNGVVVVSKYSDGRAKIWRDMDPSIIFEGPLVILTSKMTASAAEIVAQSLQDWGVALVVGDPQTYGKGSIQTQTVTDNNGSGFFKVTVGQYYTVSGKSPQQTGVRADIIVPSPLSYQFPHNEEAFLGKSRIDEQFQDLLADIDADIKPWYARYYSPFLQRKVEQWRDYLPSLKERSRLRLTQKGDHSLLVRETDFDRIKSQDLQLQEAIDIVKDMVLLEPKIERENKYFQRGL